MTTGSENEKNGILEAAETPETIKAPEEEAPKAPETEAAEEEKAPGAAAQAPRPEKNAGPLKKSLQGMKKAAAERVERAAKEKTRKSKEELQAELAARKAQLVHMPAEMSGKLKQMLADEIENYKKREKSRGAEILAVFAKHNFYANGFTPEELRTTLEDLGPTYVKIGQIMSSRVDMLPVSYCRELEKLRQNVKPLDPLIARAVIEQETGRSIDEIYSEFRDKPLGSASIGQAHYGVLKDGTRVVTKVQRPLIADMMRKDFVLLKKLAKLLGAVTGSGDEEEEMVDLVSVIEELEKVTEEELDFRVEAENTRFFKENCIEDETKVTCPTVIDDLTTERIFTMTFVDGVSVAKKEKLEAEGCDLNAIGTALIENYVHQVLDVGTFHGDPHQGNIMVSHGVPCWIDFGMIGRITEGDVNNIQALILGMLEGDMDAMVNAVMSLGSTTPKTSRNRLLEDMDGFLGKYMSVSTLKELDMSVVLGEVSEIAARNHISLPGKFTMLVRSIGTIEGVIEQLCPDVHLFEIISNKFLERAKKSFDLSQSLLSAGKDVLSVGRKAGRMPSLAYDVMNNLVKGRMKLNLELTGYEELAAKVAATVRDVVLALFACVLFIGSCMLTGANIQPKLPNDMPLLAAAGLLFSIGLGIYTVKRMARRK